MFDSRVGRFVAVSMVVVGLPLAGSHLRVLPQGVLPQGVLPMAGPEVGELNAEPGSEMRDDGAERVDTALVDLQVGLDDAVFGRSGALRTVQALPGAPIVIPLDWSVAPPTGSWYRWIPAGSAGLATDSPGLAGAPKEVASVLGADAIPLPEGAEFLAPREPGLYHLEVGADQLSWVLDEVTLIVQVPFKRKQGTHLQGYFIGRYPTEGKGRTDRYAPPVGFIEVTPENQNLQLSDHFKIREFLTKDQHNVWPKYLVVDPRLLEKLELMMQELNSMGVRAERIFVMSGFRTPQYNARGLGQGRASLSRHQFGDAADVWIDNDLNGYIDDLNGDGKRDTGDVRVMLRAIERVEEKYPDLVGGAGVYRANAAHGPFLHVDVRGTRARW